MKNSTYLYPLRFSPTSVLQVDCRLEVLNSLNLDKVIYNIKGFGEHPLAEGNILISCLTKRESIKEIVVVNPYFDKEITYSIDI